MKITIAEVKRRLPVGTEYIGTYVGKFAYLTKGYTTCKRKVVRNTNTLESVFLDGSRAEERVFLPWRSVTATENHDGITLSDDNGEFLRIKL
jgi:hypothetical protein